MITQKNPNTNTTLSLTMRLLLNKRMKLVLKQTGNLTMKTNLALLFRDIQRTHSKFLSLSILMGLRLLEIILMSYQCRPSKKFKMTLSLKKTNLTIVIHNQITLEKKHLLSHLTKKKVNLLIMNKPYRIIKLSNLKTKITLNCLLFSSTKLDARLKSLIFTSLKKT